MVREQLIEPHQILFRHHARRAQLTLTLARLLGEDVTTMGLGSLEPFGSLAKTLRRCPVGLQLGHNNSELQKRALSWFSPWGARGTLGRDNSRSCCSLFLSG